MGDGDHILHHCLLWGELLLSEYHQSAVIGVTEMTHGPIGKAYQTILLGEYRLLNLPGKNLIDQARDSAYA
jgi:hypothetical protein